MGWPYAIAGAKRTWLERQYSPHVGDVTPKVDASSAIISGSNPHIDVGGRTAGKSNFFRKGLKPVIRGHEK